MNRQLKMVFSINKSTQPTQPTQPSQPKQLNRSAPTPAQINSYKKSMFNIGNKSCGCG